MNGRTIARATTAVTALGIGAALTLAGPAAADPEPSPLDSGLAHLTETAGPDPVVQAGVGALTQYTKLADVAALRHVTSAFTPFAYAAPTFGCGSIGPITTIIAAATTDGAGGSQDLNVEPGTLRFSATPAHTGTPLASGLVVAWVNINNGASGINSLDDITEYGLPSLSKTVHSGPGTVIASMWGIIDYPFAHCVMTPTVGTFMVPDQPAGQPVKPPTTTAPDLGTPGPNGTEIGPAPERAPSTAPKPAPAPAPAPPAAPPAPEPAPAPAPPAPPTTPSVPAGAAVHGEFTKPAS
ncbi:hypothetical protein [Nocardia iowensis]|uniref:Uncharacterized protein n=1 Tax=Nocardia iowensis TaxID=204891 RepID=A0ABX8RLG2_NOCIO|nr:hypothetical protein [Nocardia iowensis]QXN90449.1 hypothetical protein KV110_34455 [Nocardia iowensis]